MKRYGCHDREPFKPAQVLHGHDSQTGRPIRVLVPFRNSPDCNFTFTELGRVDPKCDGCKHKSTTERQA